VQQGEVSSTEPPLPEPSLLLGQVPEISAYFEALEHYISGVGWVLLQVNANGIIESCTQNIRDLIGYEKQELYHQPLYRYLYSGDHTKLEPIINNMYNPNGGGSSSASNPGPGGSSGGPSAGVWGDLEELNNGNASQQSAGSNSSSGGAGGQGGGGGGGAAGGGGTAVGKSKRSISTKVRMLVKDTRTATQTSSNCEEKPLRQSGHQDKYEEVVLIAAPVKGEYRSTHTYPYQILKP